jgi:hypothetical protein
MWHLRQKIPLFLIRMLIIGGGRRRLLGINLGKFPGFVTWIDGGMSLLT